MRTAIASIVVAAGIALGARTAAAQIDVNLAFTPSNVNAGQSVTFFGSVANLGAEPVTAALELTVRVAGFTLGPVRTNLALGAGQERSAERAMTIPSFIPSGTLTLTLRGTAGSFSDTATASLAVTNNAVAVPTADQLRAFANGILDAMSGAPLASESDTFGAIKNLYR